MQETYSNPTILIVDDSQTDRDTYRRYLQSLINCGYRILDCESAEDALDLCQRDRPQLILLDYLLHDMDGLEFLRQLANRMETLPPTIMLTGEGSEMVAVEAMKLGVKDYQVKQHLTPQNLVNAITNALTQQQLQAQIDRQQQQQNLLARIMLQIGASIELPVILQTAVDGMRQLLDCDRAIMYKFSPDLSGTVISQSVLPQWEPIDLQIEQAGFAIQNLESVAKYLDGSKLVVSDIETADLESSDVDMLQQFQVKALLAVPILFHDILPIGMPMVWGLLIVYNCKAARIWQPEELDLVDRLSIQMAIAIQQAELVSDLKIALQQQQALLDIVPMGITIAEDANCDVIRVNGYAQAMLSVTGDTNASATGSEAETLPFRQYQNGKEIPGDQLPMQLASSQGIAIKDFEMQMVRADGFTQDWLVNAIPLFNEAGEVRASIAAIADVTKLKKIEADLRQSEEFKKRILESSTDCIKLIDIDGQILYINTRGVSLLEIDDSSQYLRQKWLDLWLDDYRIQAEEAITKARAGEVGKFCGYRTTPKGTPKWWEVIVSPIRDASENVQQLLVVSRDISDRHLKELNANFLAEIQTDLNYLTDPTEIMSVIGEKIRCFFNFSLLVFADIDVDADRSQTVYNSREADIIDTVASCDLTDYLGKRYLDRLKTGNTVAIADTHTDPDIVNSGEAYIPYEVRSQVLVPQLGNGKWKFMLGGSRRNPSNWRTNELELLVELTARLYLGIERNRAESALKQSEERYRQLVELIPQLVWTATPEGLLLDVNQRWLDFTGLTLAQAKSESWKTVIYADDLPTLNQYWELAQQEGKYEAEGRMLQADGQYRWHLHQAIAQKNERGQITKWFGTATDIDDLKQLEQQYREILVKVQERNQELDQFTHIVSHDLKAPLRAISNLAQWLEDDLEDSIPPENQQQLQLMRSRVSRMEGLINLLLNYARIGREEISTDLVSIQDLLAEIIDSLDPPSTFRIEVASALPTFCTKRIRLNQVLSNLIGNAIKHHDRPNGKISISVEEYAESPEYYKFVIADDGKGIDPQQQKRIFNIFQTLDGDKSESTGIGLAIVQKIVENQGGSIWVESSLGQGSVFSFTWR